MKLKCTNEVTLNDSLIKLCYVLLPNIWIARRGKKHDSRFLLQSSSRSNYTETLQHTFTHWLFNSIQFIAPSMSTSFSLFATTVGAVIVEQTLFILRTSTMRTRTCAWNHNRNHYTTCMFRVFGLDRVCVCFFCSSACLLNKLCECAMNVLIVNSIRFLSQT